MRRLWLGFVVVVPALGCLSPQQAVKDADDAAYDIIAEKQEAAIGRQEPFTIEQLEDRLRRRLMIEQGLPAAGEASLGRAFLPPVPKQPDGVTGDEPVPGDVPLVRHQSFDITGVGTETLATDIALVDIGSNPEGTEPVVSASIAPGLPARTGAVHPDARRRPAGRGVQQPGLPSK